MENINVNFFKSRPEISHLGYTHKIDFLSHLSSYIKL